MVYIYTYIHLKCFKVNRLTGDAKPKYVENTKTDGGSDGVNGLSEDKKEVVKEAAAVPKSKDDEAGVIDDRIQMRRYTTSEAFSDDVLK